MSGWPRICVTSASTPSRNRSSRAIAALMWRCASAHWSLPSRPNMGRAGRNRPKPFVMPTPACNRSWPNARSPSATRTTQPSNRCRRPNCFGPCAIRPRPRPLRPNGAPETSISWSRSSGSRRRNWAIPTRWLPRSPARSTAQWPGSARNRNANWRERWTCPTKAKVSQGQRPRYRGQAGLARHRHRGHVPRTARQPSPHAAPRI